MFIYIFGANIYIFTFKLILRHKQTNCFLCLGYDWKYSFCSVQLYCVKCSHYCIFHILINLFLLLTRYFYFSVILLYFDKHIINKSFRILQIVVSFLSTIPANIILPVQPIDHSVSNAKNERALYVHAFIYIYIFL